ncbi:hypothetical protein GCM10011499_18170 [Pelagibacterium lentulum]|uniref:Uncharacterized protein n=1 Tax=Pelagibacterium lentulum TaxID=2029865 RepID=A0A916RBR2_9HYPH|nr:hypothetical protein GCM10011499_18170 [Pelagibacterium lentulum]
MRLSLYSSVKGSEHWVCASRTFLAASTSFARSGTVLVCERWFRKYMAWAI